MESVSVGMCRRMQNGKKLNLLSLQHLALLTLKRTLGPSVIHSMSGAHCGEPQSSPIPHPPTFASDSYTNTPVIATGRQTETFKTTTAHASNRSTFFPFHLVSGRFLFKPFAWHVVFVMLYL